MTWSSSLPRCEMALFEAEIEATGASVSSTNTRTSADQDLPPLRDNELRPWQSRVSKQRSHMQAASTRANACD